MHPAKVVKVGSPNGDGDIQVECTGLWGTEVSNWIPVAGNNLGSNNTSRKQTGSWIPAQPGQMGFVFFPGGNYKKPVFLAAGPWLESKGSAG
jgi:hypothetical protein